MSTEISYGRSPSIGQLAEALSKAQGSMTGAAKDSDNPFFKSKYADLAAVWEACRKPLSDNGLAVVQIPVTASGRVAVETILTHSSGEWISGTLEMTPVKADPQGIGSAITYARRYGLQAMVGIAPEDDDGNSAAGNTYQRKKDKRMAELEQEWSSVSSVSMPISEYIDINQMTNFLIECRKAVRKERELEADAIIDQWLKDNNYMDGSHPSALKIKAGGWLAEKKKAIAWIKAQ